MSNPISSRRTSAALDLRFYPDGGMARVRLWGDLSEEGRAALTQDWYEALPADHVRQITENDG